MNYKNLKKKDVRLDQEEGSKENPKGNWRGEKMYGR